MLLVLKRTVSMRRFFWAPKTYAEIMGRKYLQFYADFFVYLNLWTMSYTPLAPTWLMVLIFPKHATFLDVLYKLQD